MERSEEHVGRVVNEAGWRQGQELNLGRPCTKQFGNYPKCGWEITEKLRAGNMLSPFVTGNAMQMFLIIIVFLIIGEAVWGPVSPFSAQGNQLSPVSHLQTRGPETKRACPRMPSKSLIATGGDWL